MKKKILVADDEMGFRDLFTYFLSRLGYEIMTCENGFDALEQVQRNEFEIIFLDMHMPVLNGLEALKRIYQARPQQKIVVLSSNFDAELKTALDTYKNTVVEFLYKPVSLSEIENALSKALQ
jgi:DNA-binding NtrC family response regulator